MVDLNQNGNLSGGKAATVTRTSGAPTDVLVAAFRGDVNANSIVSGADAFYVLSVKKVIESKLDTAKMAELRKEMQNMSKENVMDDYNSFLIREYPIEINEKLFNRMFAN